MNKILKSNRKQKKKPCMKQLEIYKIIAEILKIIVEILKMLFK